MIGFSYWNKKKAKNIPTVFSRLCVCVCMCQMCDLISKYFIATAYHVMKIFHVTVLNNLHSHTNTKHKESVVLETHNCDFWQLCAGHHVTAAHMHRLTRSSNVKQTVLDVWHALHRPQSISVIYNITPTQTSTQCAHMQTLSVSKKCVCMCIFECAGLHLDQACGIHKQWFLSELCLQCFLYWQEVTIFFSPSLSHTHSYIQSMLLWHIPTKLLKSV